MNESYKESFEKTKKAGEIAAGALDEVAKVIKPGIQTDKIDKLCYEYINDNGAYSAPLFYRGFPKSCCTSTNHIVCHGIPSDKILKDGDHMVNALEIRPMLVGFLFAFLSAACAVKWFVNYLNKNGLVPFAWYRIGLAIAVFLLLGK